ncbi:hypothetical protein ONE63_008436 [Megalurothrips usitatus]|uniref:Uncharacterized protein n=1 Tax=Megalurothrips usitatus TaxID=439358 RepID=A0AAV7XMF8_9NEOP|nr:hypothetical protein ONE63_008436 [Megalurothrips usitatus]
MHASFPYEPPRSRDYSVSRRVGGDLMVAHPLEQEIGLHSTLGSDDNQAAANNMMAQCNTFSIQRQIQEVLKEAVVYDGVSLHSMRNASAPASGRDSKL